MKGVSHPKLLKVALEMEQAGQIVLVRGTMDADCRLDVAVRV